MLAKKFKLTGSKDFEKVQKNGKVYQSTNFGIAYLEQETPNVSRYAFVVSTKIAKEAVDRNRLKRIMSETVRIMTQQIKDGYEIVFLAKPSLARTPSEEIVREVRSALRESGLMK